ncbi:uncharacterized protein LOC8051056 [Ixodes scapularis]|uniref:uncharacterized protein LOC8051056 n=1 Tax=Ixodes scapularis TaxID=6945 RepID=UPI001A9DC338|nr:uncharacterized protein LOC8051056 [Ixodes scapularis]
MYFKLVLAFTFAGFLLLRAVDVVWDLFVLVAALIASFVWASHVSRMLVRMIKAGRIQTVNKSVFITGCEVGFGRDAAIELAHRGFTVFAACATLNDPYVDFLKRTPNVTVLSLSVLNTEDLSNAVKAVTNHPSGKTACLPYELMNLKSFRALAPSRTTSAKKEKKTVDTPSPPPPPLGRRRSSLSQLSQAHLNAYGDEYLLNFKLNAERRLLLFARQPHRAVVEDIVDALTHRYPLLSYNSAASGDVLLWTLLEVLPAEFTDAILNRVMGGKQPQPRLQTAVQPESSLASMIGLTGSGVDNTLFPRR